MRLLRAAFFLLNVAQGLLRAQHGIAFVFGGAFGVKKRYGNSLLSYNVVAPMSGWGGASKVMFLR